MINVNELIEQNKELLEIVNKYKYMLEQTLINLEVANDLYKLAESKCTCGAFNEEEDEDDLSIEMYETYKERCARLGVEYNIIDDTDIPF